MSKKKWIIVILSILIIIIGIITMGLITVSKRKDSSKVNNPKNEKQEEIIEKADDKEKEEETETATPQEEPIQEEVIDNTIDQNPPATINSNNNKNYIKEQPKIENNNQQNIIQEEEPIYNPPEPVNPPPKTYSCPPDYTLNGTQCITSYPAITSCPDGMHSFSDGTLSGCINMNEGYFAAEDDTCLEGYGMLMIVSLFEENKYKCLPIHPSIVNCNEGYTLQESTCTKVIPATEN